MEHGAVGGIGIRTEHAAGREDLDGRPHLIHGADLAVGGLGAQQQVAAQVERILHIPGGMILGHIQAGEVVGVVVDLGGFVHGKAHAGEDVNDLLLHQGDGMQAARIAQLGGQGNVHCLGGVAGGQLLGLDAGGGGLILGLHLALEFVDDLTGSRAFLLGNGAQLLHQAGDLAVLAQVLLPEGGQALAAGHTGEAGIHLSGQFFDDFLHLNAAPFLHSGAGQRKKPRPSR